MHLLNESEFYALNARLNACMLEDYFKNHGRILVRGRLPKCEDIRIRGTPHLIVLSGGQSEDSEEVGTGTVCDPGLLAVEDVVPGVGTEDRARLHRRRVCST